VLRRGTSVGATDDIGAVCEVAARHGLFVHVDAAWAGSAMICPEFRHFWRGLERADSIVVNPHKWLGAQFDCSVLFTRDAASLLRTLAIHPDYLRTDGKGGIVGEQGAEEAPAGAGPQTPEPDEAKDADDVDFRRVVTGWSKEVQ